MAPVQKLGASNWNVKLKVKDKPDFIQTHRLYLSTPEALEKTEHWHSTLAYPGSFG